MLSAWAPFAESISRSVIWLFVLDDEDEKWPAMARPMPDAPPVMMILLGRKMVMVLQNSGLNRNICWLYRSVRSIDGADAPSYLSSPQWSWGISGPNGLISSQ